MVIYYAFAFIIGCLVVISPILNGRNAQRLSTLRGSFYNYLFALFSAVLLAFYFVNDSRFTSQPLDLPNLLAIPWTHYLGGLIGCLVILIMNYFTVRIKAYFIVTLPFIGQMATGILLDQLGGELFTTKQFLGLGLILLGLVISVTMPQKNNSKLLHELTDSLHN